MGKTFISEWPAQQSGTEVLESCISVSTKNFLRGHEVWGMFTTESSSCALDYSAFGDVSLWSDLLYSLQADYPSLQMFHLSGSLGFAHHTSCLSDSLMVPTLFFYGLPCSLNILGLPSSSLPSLCCVSWKTVQLMMGSQWYGNRGAMGQDMALVWPFSSCSFLLVLPESHIPFTSVLAFLPQQSHRLVSVELPTSKCLGGKKKTFYLLKDFECLVLALSRIFKLDWNMCLDSLLCK